MGATGSSAKDWPAALVQLFPGVTHTPGADAAARQELEAQLAIRLPDSLLVFLGGLAIHPRLQMRLGEFRWLSLDQIGVAWRQQTPWATAEEVDKDIAGESDDRIARVAHHRQRVPIAEFNGDVWIFLDHAPTAVGTVGQVIQVDPEGLSWFWLAPSFDQLLIDLANGRVLDPGAGTQE